MFLSEILLIKILVTMTVVVGLSLLAEHVSTRLAGILAGYPHGIAIVLYFLGMEQGMQFASAASIYAIGGLAANVILVYAYHLLCRSRHWSNLLLAVAGSVGVFLGISLLLRQFDFKQVMACLIAIAAIILVAILLRPVSNRRVSGKVTIGYTDLVLRALLSTCIVLMVTETADILGPDWSGLLSGFPVVTFPLLMIIHVRHGREAVSTMVKNYPYGLVSLVIFTLTVSFAYPRLGLNTGTLLGFITATIYLAALSFYIWKRPLRKSAASTSGP